jgi:hypothetical protein
MKTVQLGGKKAAGRVARVDDGDYDLVTQHRWHVLEQYRPGKTTYGPYAQTDFKENGVHWTLTMHILILGIRTGIDHADGDGLNNQRYNLRPAGQRLNMANQQTRVSAGKTSRFKGVCWDKSRGKWMAGITINRRHVNLGRFLCEEDAARTYDAAALAAWGGFARLNFPEG